jgi:hypothetical protein
MYELFVLCRRRPPAPPGGFAALSGQPWIEEVRPDEYWNGIGAGYLRAEASSVFGVFRTGEGSLPVMESLARALADGGDGVVLSRVPVTMPWRFDLEHEGREPPADWPALLARAGHYREVEQKAREEARKKLAEEKARWEARMKPEDLKEIDFTDAFKVDGDKNDGMGARSPFSVDPLD